METEAEAVAKNERRQELRNVNLLAWRQGKPGVYKNRYLGLLSDLYSYLHYVICAYVYIILIAIRFFCIQKSRLKYKKEQHVH